MLANFKGKQNTNWFAHNTQNINMKWRPIDTIAYITKENIRKWDYSAGIPETLEYIRKKWDKLSIKDLNNISRLCELERNTSHNHSYVIHWKTQ